MTSRPSRLLRWRERGADRRALEERAALLADAAREVPPAAPEMLARVRAQVLAQRPASAPAWRGIGRLSVRARLALGVALLLLSMATARGASFLWRSYFRPAPLDAPAPAAAPLRVKAPPAARAARGVTPPAAPAAVTTAVASVAGSASPSDSTSAQAPPPGPAPAPPSGATPRPNGAEPEVAHRAPRANLAAARPEAPGSEPAPPVAAAPEPAALAAPAHLAPAPPATAAPETEARLLAQALTQLRQLADPRATLATLDRHAQQFPHGVLESEARGIRIEALIQLQDPRTALALLDAPPATPDALGAKLVIARAELRANADRCADALPDFTWILSSATVTRGGDIDERAWHGRALCLERLGLKARARADFASYLRLYPRGRFAAEVARLLDEGAGQTRP